MTILTAVALRALSGEDGSRPARGSSPRPALRRAAQPRFGLWVHFKGKYRAPFKRTIGLLFKGVWGDFLGEPPGKSPP